jgi:hypothetical protein
VVPDNPRVFNPNGNKTSDPFIRTVAHEISHALTRDYTNKSGIHFPTEDGVLRGKPESQTTKIGETLRDQLVTPAPGAMPRGKNYLLHSEGGCWPDAYEGITKEPPPKRPDD